MSDPDHARAVIGYDPFWDGAGVIDLVLLDAQVRELAAAENSHAEQHRFAMWRAYVTRVCSAAITDTVLDGLLALDMHEAARPGPGLGHGIALDLADRFTLTDAQRDRLAQHPVTDGLTRDTLDRKLAARRQR